MNPLNRLFAKSRGIARAPHPQTIAEHTEAVIRCGLALLEVTGDQQLRAVGLEPELWRERFRRDFLIAALVHDLGKANSHFQNMIQAAINEKLPSGGQAYRHEAISYLMVKKTDIESWLLKAFDGAENPQRELELALWAAAGHHRKFPLPSNAQDHAECSMQVFLDHPDFQEALKLGVKFRPLLPAPPTLRQETWDACENDGALSDTLSESKRASKKIKLKDEEKRYLAVLKAHLVGSDVAGSIGFHNGQSMEKWIHEAFRNVPSVEDMNQIVQDRLGIGNNLRDFQTSIGEQIHRVTFVQAGCGSGKTLGAYHWASRQVPGQRLFFCYPTTGTATEGFRDYLILKDRDLEAKLVHGRAHIDMEILGTGDNDDLNNTNASILNDAIDLWSTPLVSCTVDTVLGLLQNHARGIMAWPSIAGSAFIFDEIHAYDDHLFGALLRFLAEVRGVRCLLMTASLPQHRYDEICEVLGRTNERLGKVHGPPELETIERYVHRQSDDPWILVQQALAKGKKVLWVVNTVNMAINLAETAEALGLDPLVYHSRYKYVDRVNRHNDVINAFKTSSGQGVLAIATQVAEMSLDLSADLLVTELAPVASLIQRLGRLNRKANPDAKPNPMPFLVTSPEQPKPYNKEDLENARQWLDSLGGGDLSQKHLAEAWLRILQSSSKRSKSYDDATQEWFDGEFSTIPGKLRESTPGIDIIHPDDKAAVRKDSKSLAKYRIPMTIPGKPWNWRFWEELSGCRIPPAEAIDYDEKKGASWK